MSTFGKIDQPLLQLDAQSTVYSIAKALTDHGIKRGIIKNVEGNIRCTHPALELLIPIVCSSTEWRSHEAVLVQVDNETQCLYIVSIHSSKRGRPEGGARLKMYQNFGQAIDDCLRLSYGMTRKNAIANIWEGGAKSVIVPYSAEVFSRLMEQQHSNRNQIGPYRAQLWANFGSFVSSLQGLYLVGEDVNLNSADMASILSHCVHTSCLEKKFGGSGNPSPYTSAGVFKAIKASVEMTFPDDPDLVGKDILVKGLGNVGYSLVEYLIKAGAQVIAHDPINKMAQKRAIEQFTADRIIIIEREDEFISTPAHVFSPNANSLSINQTNIDQLKVKIICGAENGQLEDVSLAERLHQQGIVYIPEPWINYMGVFSAYQEHCGILKAEFKEKTDQIYQDTKTMLKNIKERGISTYQYVNEIADIKSIQLNPILGHRGIKIIEELFEQWIEESKVALTEENIIIA